MCPVNLDHTNTKGNCECHPMRFSLLAKFSLVAIAHVLLICNLLGSGMLAICGFLDGVLAPSRFLSDLPLSTEWCHLWLLLIRNISIQPHALQVGGIEIAGLITSLHGARATVLPARVLGACIFQHWGRSGTCLWWAWWPYNFFVARS